MLFHSGIVNIAVWKMKTKYLWETEPSNPMHHHNFVMVWSPIRQVYLILFLGYHPMPQEILSTQRPWIAHDRPAVPRPPSKDCTKMHELPRRSRWNQRRARACKSGCSSRRIRGWVGALPTGNPTWSSQKRVTNQINAPSLLVFNW